MFRRDISFKLRKRAEKIMPDGVNHSNRDFKKMGVPQIFFKTGKGSRLITVNNKTYIDYICGWGNIILGHTNQVVLKSLVSQLSKGMGSGINSRLEIEYAELLVKSVPGIEMVRFFGSPFEALLNAIGIASFKTKRNKFVIFKESRYLNSKVIQAFNSEFLEVSFNDMSSVEKVFDNNKDRISAVIIEPIATGLGCILPVEGFLMAVKKLCTENGALFIFDETITGFRLSLGGAQEYFHLNADMVIHGNIAGGGFSLGILGGSKELMELKTGFNDNNFSNVTNPIVLSAGYATIKHLKDNQSIYKYLDEKSNSLTSGIKEILTKKGLPFTLNRIGSVFSLYFTQNEVKGRNQANKTDKTLFKSFYKHLFKNGILLPPFPFFCGFISNAHSERDIRKTFRVLKKWSAKIKEKKNTET